MENNTATTPKKVSDFNADKTSDDSLYKMIESFFYGFVRKNIDEIMKYISPDIKFQRKDNPREYILGAENFKDHALEYLSTTQSYLMKLFITGWDPVLEKGFASLEYHHWDTKGNYKEVYEVAIFQLKHNLISYYTSAETVMRTYHSHK